MFFFVVLQLFVTCFFFFFQAEDGIRDYKVTGVQTCALPIYVVVAGGPAVITVTTTFTAGDNNVFGPFTRTTTCAVDLGVRAPIVISVTPSTGNCAVQQDLLITGACFTFTTPGPNGPVVNTVTSAFALERGNTANRVNA